MTDRSNPFRPSQAEIDRRYKNVRAAMKAADLEVLIVSGSEYTGFEGGVQYMCGFHILHRYAYVLVPIEGEPICVFPGRQPGWGITPKRSWTTGSFRPSAGNGWRTI